MSKINLTDCTFLIPVRIESNDRLRNVITGLCYILSNFDTNIIVKEIDSKSVFSEYALPQIEEFVGESLNINHIFEESSDELFHRMRCINEMISISKTKVVVNYDCDVLLPKDSYVDSVNSILESKSDVVYPYGNGIYQVKVNANDELVSNFLNKDFDFKISSVRSIGKP